ncbi:MAG: twin-arginine translocase subunit TatB [Thiobacillus sp.]|nr:twin-arginine translocase subunit TatB [Thiobacillus sp.]
MFDIGFSELIVIGVVALIVIGPERLPKVARTAGHLYGRLQRYVSSVKSDISQEIEFDELRRAGQQFKQSVESTVTDVQQQATVVDDYLRDEATNLSESVTSSDAPEAFPPLSEPPRKRVEAPAPQQSLPLDEPDQNRSRTTKPDAMKPTTPAAIVETAGGDSAGKTT